MLSKFSLSNLGSSRAGGIQTSAKESPIQKSSSLAHTSDFLYSESKDIEDVTECLLPSEFVLSKQKQRLP